MPIYEYTCAACNKSFDHLAKSMADADARVKCPSCGSVKTKRAMSVFAVSAQESKSAAPGPGMCGRCCGDGPCPMGD